VLLNKRTERRPTFEAAIVSGRQREKPQKEDFLKNLPLTAYSVSRFLRWPTFPIAAFLLLRTVSADAATEAVAAAHARPLFYEVPPRAFLLLRPCTPLREAVAS